MHGSSNFVGPQEFRLSRIRPLPHMLVRSVFGAKIQCQRNAARKFADMGFPADQATTARRASMGDPSFALELLSTETPDFIQVEALLLSLLLFRLPSDEIADSFTNTYKHM